MYVHVLYVCACIFQYAFSPDMPVRFSWRKTCPKCFLLKSWQINFCWWVNVCMCLYCMYVYVSYVYVCIVAAGTRITAASPNDRLLRRHPAGLTQGIPGHGRKHFFPPSLYPRTTRFRAPPPSSPVGGPWTAPPVRLVGVPGQIRACRPGPKPHPSLLGKFRRSLRHTASATAPQRPLPTVIGACMYVPVCACICMYCMYMYVYVCIVCMCVYLTRGNKYPQISPSVRATVGSVGDTDPCHSGDGCSSHRII